MTSRKRPQLIDVELERQRLACVAKLEAGFSALAVGDVIGGDRVYAEMKSLIATRLSQHGLNDEARDDSEPGFGAA